MTILKYGIHLNKSTACHFELPNYFEAGMFILPCFVIYQMMFCQAIYKVCSQSPYNKFKT